MIRTEVVSAKPWSIILIGLASLCMVSNLSAQSQSLAPFSVAALKQADREFFETVSVKRLDGWMSYFAEDAVRVDLFGQSVQGLTKIREVDQGLFANPQNHLIWAPDEAGLFKDPRYGFTKGHFRFVSRIKDQPEVLLGKGFYLTLWRYDNDRWWVILDTGAPQPAEKPELKN